MLYAFLFVIHTDYYCQMLCIKTEIYEKLSYRWETVQRESMPRIAEMDVEMTT